MELSESHTLQCLEGLAEILVCGDHKYGDLVIQGDKTRRTGGQGARLACRAIEDGVYNEKAEVYINLGLCVVLHNL